MTPIDEHQRRQVAEAIARAERRTDAELVTVLARRADDYAYLPLLWAALLAIVLPSAAHLLSGWPSLRGVLVTQVLLFVVCCLVLRHTPVAARLVPSLLRRRCAAALARQQFHQQHLQRTAGATGVLIFVCEAERYVTILTDSGTAQHLDEPTRAALVARLAERVGEGRTVLGLVECIDACGELLGRTLPSVGRRNQLTNQLVVLD